MTDDPQTETLAAFAIACGLPDIARITQRGREPDTARYTIEFTDGRSVRVGTIKTLWSRVELSKALAVTIQRVIAPMKPAEWNEVVGALIMHGIDVEETPDESFQDTVREWLSRYADRATNGNGNSHQEAASIRAPFIRDGELHVSATEFAKYVRREYSESSIKLPELRQALSDLGYAATHISFDRGRGATKTRSSASYYRGPLLTTSNPE